jgi:hypothetical protein
MTRIDDNTIKYAYLIKQPMFDFNSDSVIGVVLSEDEANQIVKQLNAFIPECPFTVEELSKANTEIALADDYVNDIQKNDPYVQSLYKTLSESGIQSVERNNAINELNTYIEEKYYEFLRSDDRDFKITKEQYDAYDKWDRYNQSHQYPAYIEKVSILSLDNYKKEIFGDD